MDKTKLSNILAAMEKENIRLVAAAIEKANGGTPMNSEYRHV